MAMNAPAPSGGGGLQAFLTRPVFGMPLWLVGSIALAGGVGLAYYLRHRTSSGTSTLGSSTSAQAVDPNIDPNTGVPYSVEESINPNTGLPAYFDLLQPLTNSPTPTPSPQSGIAPQPTQPPGPTVVTGANVAGSVINPPPMYYQGRLILPQQSQQRVTGTSGAYGGSYGGTQATPYWPHAYDVTALRGTVRPGIPELAEKSETPGYERAEGGGV